MTVFQDTNSSAFWCFMSLYDWYLAMNCYFPLKQLKVERATWGVKFHSLQTAPASGVSLGLSVAFRQELHVGQIHDSPWYFTILHVMMYYFMIFHIFHNISWFSMIFHVNPWYLYYICTLLYYDPKLWSGSSARLPSGPDSKAKGNKKTQTAQKTSHAMPKAWAAQLMA